MPPRLSAAQKLVLQYYRAKLHVMHVINARWAAAAAIDLFTRPYANRRRKDPAIWQQARPLSLVSGSIKLAGFSWQPSQPNGLSLLIAHGFAGNSRSFERFIKPALAMGYRVVAFDAPGHGKSEGSRLNVLSYSWMLQDVIKHHGPFNACLAHSLGGMSLALALQQQPPPPGAKLVLIAPLVEASRAADGFFNFLELPAGLRQHFEAEIENRAGHPLAWFSLPRLLKALPAVQILWVHDEQDDTTPFADVAPLLAQPPQGVQFMVTQGLGHSAIYRDNKVKRQVLAFLEP